MKKSLSVLLACIMMFSFVSTSFAASLRGDVDGDSKVTSADALSVLLYTVGQERTINKAKADLNGDNAINSADALIILQICVGIIPSSSIPTTSKEIVELYNSALKTTYYKPKLTVKYTNIDSGVTSDLTSKKDTPFKDTNSKTVECVNGINQQTGSNIDVLHPGCSLDSNGVASAAVQEGSNGTRTVKIILKEEKTSIFSLPVYNRQAALPFVYTSEASGGTTTYTGTTLTLVINSKNEAVSLTVKMPYVCDYQQKVSGSLHSMKDTGCTDYSATYTF